MVGQVHPEGLQGLGRVWVDRLHDQQPARLELDGRGTEYLEQLVVGQVLNHLICGNRA